MNVDKNISKIVKKFNILYYFNTRDFLGVMGIIYMDREHYIL
jgi:hypothetical protein